ncbi:oxidoreductase [Roseiarcus sp.]|uniref:oxidoreductase n=1 Tax=Roseiarcus sp. TaxID=1969460 RepID=UPI003D0BF860
MPKSPLPILPDFARPLWRTPLPNQFGSLPAVRPGSVASSRSFFSSTATASSPRRATRRVAGNPKNGLALALDVDKQGQIDAAVKAAEARFGRIDVLVNNAGYGYLAAVEEGDDADIRAMFETNFFGLAAMTRAALPIMRAQKSGAIVNISSVGGFIGFPGSGYYAATKFAVEGLSESLSKEVGPLGIKVIIVEPGPFRTDWAGRSLKTPRKPVDAYADTAIARRRQIQGISGSQAGDPVRASEAIIATVEKKDAPLRLPLGGVAYDAIAAEIAALRKEHDSVEAVARGADYPKAS